MATEQDLCFVVYHSLRKHQLLSFPRMAKVCSAEQSADRDRHLGCGVCSESRSGTAPIPNRILREGTSRIFSAKFREGGDIKQFLAIYKNKPREGQTPTPLT